MKWNFVFGQANPISLTELYW